jgi:transcriptional regulator with XRE-family HTH domain
MVLIHEKISALLEQRHLKKRDLARALGVSPQTATDICKGRSAITLPHLRNLVAFFALRADFWLDDQRLLPESLDLAGKVGAGGNPAGNRVGDALARTGLLAVADPERLLRAIRSFVARHRAEFLAANPSLTAAERAVLGLVEAEHGSVGRLAEE